MLDPFPSGRKWFEAFEKMASTSETYLWNSTIKRVYWIYSNATGREHWVLVSLYAWFDMFKLVFHACITVFGQFSSDLKRPWSPIQRFAECRRAYSIVDTFQESTTTCCLKGTWSQDWKTSNSEKPAMQASWRVHMVLSDQHVNPDLLIHLFSSIINDKA